MYAQVFVGRPPREGPPGKAPPGWAPRDGQALVNSRQVNRQARRRLHSVRAAPTWLFLLCATTAARGGQEKTANRKEIPTERHRLLDVALCGIEAAPILAKSGAKQGISRRWVQQRIYFRPAPPQRSNPPDNDDGELHSITACARHWARTAKILVRRKLQR
jgi:hypothetical protein